MKTNLFFAALMAVAIAVSGCGGGGGGSESASVATTTPSTPVASAVVTLDATKNVPPSDGSFVPVSVKPSVTWSIVNGAYASSTVTLSCKASGDVAGKSTVAGNTATFTPAAPLPYASNCGLKWVVNATPSGATATATRELVFNTEPQPPVPSVLVCTAPQVANSTGTKCIDPPPVCAAPQVYLKVLNACVYPTSAAGTRIALSDKKVAAGCSDWHDQCWKDASTNGTVTWIAESQVATGVNDRSVAWAYFFNGGTPSPTNGNYSIKLFYADTNEPVNGGSGTGDIDKGYINETDWVMENTEIKDPKGNLIKGGLIQHEKVTGLCYLFRWYPVTTDPNAGASGAWSNKLVDCPKP